MQDDYRKKLAECCRYGNPTQTISLGALQFGWTKYFSAQTLAE
jgi:hypothetical protein